MSAPHRCPDELRHRAFDGYLRQLKELDEPASEDMAKFAEAMGDPGGRQVRALFIAMSLSALPKDDREVAAAILEHAGAHHFAEVTRRGGEA